MLKRAPESSRSPHPPEVASPGHAALEAAEPVRSLDHASVDKLRPTVLVVDDHHENCDLYRECLTPLGFRVIVADNGANAIQMALTHAPDVIVMDVSMPVMDGYTATTLLKSDENTRSIPIVVLTATGMEQRAEAAGCDVFLVKPCSLEELEGVLRTCLEIRRGGGVP